MGFGKKPSMAHPATIEPVRKVREKGNTKVLGRFF